MAIAASFPLKSNNTFLCMVSSLNDGLMDGNGWSIPGESEPFLLCFEKGPQHYD